MWKNKQTLQCGLPAVSRSSWLRKRERGEERPEDRRGYRRLPQPRVPKKKPPASIACDSRVNVKNQGESAQTSANDLVSKAGSKGMRQTFFFLNTLSSPTSPSWNLCSIKNLEYPWSYLYFSGPGEESGSLAKLSQACGRQAGLRLHLGLAAPDMESTACSWWDFTILGVL